MIENNDLKCALAEHQEALEFIMAKYRMQVRPCSFSTFQENCIDRNCSNGAVIRPDLGFAINIEGQRGP